MIYDGKMKKSILAVIFVGGLMTAGFSEVVWHEGEEFSEVKKGVEQAVGRRPPASNGAALNGSALDVKGDSVKYKFSLEQDIKSARIIFRYARLHWKAGMLPAEFTCSVNNSGKAYNAVLSFGDTRGWGTNSGAEWDLVEAKLGDLGKGPVEIILTVSSPLGDVTIDGFFIGPENFKITKEELSGLNRIKIYHYGYVGIDLAYSALEQNAFSGFNIVIREFGRKTWNVRSVLTDEKGKEIISFAGNTGLDVSGTAKKSVDPNAVIGLPDGNYNVLVSWNEGKDSLEHPFTALGGALDAAEKKKKEYFEFLAGSPQMKFPQAAHDLEHAVDYIGNTIALLRSKRGAGSESDRRRALSFFEKARNRTAASFVADLGNIVKQSDETIGRLKKGLDPYRGRYGDIRKAFVSKATGKLEPYRLYIPKAYENKEKLPVMLVLHGGGGDENYYPDMADGAVLNIMEKHGIIMISPKATSWYKDDGAKDLLQLINLVLAELPKADRSLIFSTGVSMGGYGTYNLAAEYPGLLAGAACVSGTVKQDYGKIENFKNTPCLILHGGADSVVPVEEARNTADKFKELGYNHELRIFPGYGHDYHAEEYMNITLDFFEKHTKFRR